MPPTAAPIGLIECRDGLAGLVTGKRGLRRFERQLRETLGVQHVFLVSSGKAALTLTLRALGSLAPEKREVIVPAYTCYSVPAAFVRAGMSVVPVEIDPETLDFDARALGEAVGPATLAVVPVHLFGLPAAVEVAAALCRERSAFLVEDAAQAMGSTHRGRALGAFGDVGIFSLGRGKSVTCGSGGVIVTDSDPIAAALHAECEHLGSGRPFSEALALASTALMALFIRPSWYWLPAGLPFLHLGETEYSTSFPIRSLSGMRAGLLRNWRRNLERGNAARAANSAYYRSRVPGAIAADEGLPWLRFPVLLGSAAEKQRVLARSREQGLGISGMYPAAIDELPQVPVAPGRAACAGAREVARRLVTLPTHHLVRPEDRERIVRLLCS